MVRNGVRDRGVAEARIVFYEDQSPAGPQTPADQPYEGNLVGLEVKSICHDDAVKRWQGERSGKIGPVVVDLELRIPHSHVAVLLTQRALVPVYGMDYA